MIKRTFIVALVIVLAVSAVFIVSADSPESQTAPDFVNEYAEANYKYLFRNILWHYQEGLGGFNSEDLKVSDGYKINFIDYNKVMGSNTYNIDSMLEDKDAEEYLYYIYTDECPVAVMTVMQKGTECSDDCIGGWAGGYIESRELLLKCAKEDDIKLYNYYMDNEYVLVAKIGGQYYALPFGVSQHIAEEYKDITDYRQLPTLKEFLDEYRWWGNYFEQEKQKDIEAGGDGILFGSFIVRPPAHDIN